MNKRVNYSLIMLVMLISISALLANIYPLSQLAYAASQTSDLKHEVKQSLNQDNLCHSSDGCKQANEGQQITGNDNTASGFNDQSTNASSLSSTINATLSPGTTEPAGIQVLSGAQGPKGDMGASGPAGAQGPKGDTGKVGPHGETGPAGEGIKFGHLIVIKHVININGGTADASDYTIHINGYNQIPDTFTGSEEGTNVTLGFGSYSVSETPAPPFKQHTVSSTFSEDCSGVIHPDETKTCTITNIYNPGFG